MSSNLALSITFTATLRPKHKIEGMYDNIAYTEQEIYTMYTSILITLTSEGMTSALNYSKMARA